MEFFLKKIGLKSSKKKGVKSSYLDNELPTST